MNIGEANAVQWLLQYLLQDQNDPLVPDSDKACAAAAELADRSRAVLHAGMSGDHVRQAWPDLDWPSPSEPLTRSGS